MLIVLQDYGGILKTLMKKYSLSVSALTIKCGLSSRTIVSRIINGRCKVTALQGFHRKLTESSGLLPFDESEWKNLKKSIEISQSGKARYCAQKNITALLENRNDSYYYLPPYNPVCDCAVGDTLEGLDLFNILKKLYNDGGNMSVYVLLSTNALNDVFFRLLESCPNIEITQFSERKTSDDESLLSASYLIKLLCRPTFNYRIIEPGYPSGIIITKRNIDGRTYTDCLNVISAGDGVINGLFRDGDAELAKYFDILISLLERESTPVKYPICDKKGLVADTFTRQCEAFERYESEWTTILIKEDLCVNEIPPELIAGVLDDVNREKIKNTSLYASLQRRYAIFLCNNRSDIHIFTYDGMVRFIKTGKLSDHPPGVRAFNRSEIMQIISRLIDASENVKGFRIYMLKNDFNQMTIKICGDRTVIYSWKPQNDEPAQIYRSDGHIAGLLREFVLSEVIGKLTWSHSKSVEFLNNLYQSI